MQKQSIVRPSFLKIIQKNELSISHKLSQQQNSRIRIKKIRQKTQQRLRILPPTFHYSFESKDIDQETMGKQKQKDSENMPLIRKALSPLSQQKRNNNSTNWKLLFRNDQLNVIKFSKNIPEPRKIFKIKRIINVNSGRNCNSQHISQGQQQSIIMGRIQNVL